MYDWILMEYMIRYTYIPWVDRIQWMITTITDTVLVPVHHRGIIVPQLWPLFIQTSYSVVLNSCSSLNIYFSFWFRIRSQFFTIIDNRNISDILCTELRVPRRLSFNYRVIWELWFVNLSWDLILYHIINGIIMNFPTYIPHLVILFIITFYPSPITSTVTNRLLLSCVFLSFHYFW